MGRHLIFFFWMIGGFTFNLPAQRLLPPVSDSLKPAFNGRILPQNFYNQHLSFFCKKELQWQKLTKLPLLIRAGARDDVDYLEKKPNAVWRPHP